MNDYRVTYKSGRHSSEPSSPYLEQHVQLVLQVCVCIGVAMSQVYKVIIVWELHSECQGVVRVPLAALDVVGTIADIRPTAHPANSL